MKTANVSMTDAQFERLRSLVYEKSGIRFQDSKKYLLESRLSRRLSELGFADFDQYFTFLTTGPFQTDEFQELFNRVTINETSFFRNEPQLNVFETRTLPQLIERRKNRKILRIWSAACSSGEEPYTLAIQIQRTLGVRLSDWRIEILGTDISDKVLTMAREGRYAHYAIRSTPASVVQRYFRETAGFYQIDPEIRSMVRFEKVNLKDGLAARRFGAWDVIFCRNVLIYFDDPMKQHCARLFHDVLADDGTLFIGHSESLRNLDVGFDIVDNPRAFAYVKSGRMAS